MNKKQFFHIIQENINNKEYNGYYCNADCIECSLFKDCKGNSRTIINEHVLKKYRRYKVKQILKVL